MGLSGDRTGILRKRHFFLIEKYIEDARQDEKHVPDLLEAIMRPTDPVKEELRQKLSKIDQFGSKIKKIRVCTFQMSGKIPDSTNVAFEDPLFAIFGPARGQIYGKTAKKYKKMRVSLHKHKNDTRRKGSCT